MPMLGASTPALDEPAAAPPQRTALQVLQDEADALRPLIQSAAALQLLDAVVDLPSVDPRVVYHNRATRDALSEEAWQELDEDSRLGYERIELGNRFYYNTRYGTPLALMMLDIDRFKDLNDRFGHAAGDAAIAALGAACRESCRAEVDLAGRLGGEEFAIVMPHTGATGALELAQRLCRTLAGLPIRHDDRELRITVSIGVAERLSGDGGIADLLKRADQALYAAKRSGRNRAVRIAA
jgi:diguanylate cyclase (GGDEF)-like protein